MQSTRFVWLMLATTIALGIPVQAAPEPLDFSGSYNCDAYVTTNEANAVTAWYNAQAPDYTNALYAYRSGKFIRAPNTAFAMTGPWVRGGAHNTSWDNDMTWFYDPKNPAKALTNTTVTTSYGRYTLALGSGFDAAPLPSPVYGATLPARLNIVRLGMPTPATGMRATSVVVQVQSPAKLANVNFLLSGMSGTTNDVRPRLKIQANYTDSTTSNLFTSPSANAGKPIGVPTPNAGLTPWAGWTKTATLQTQIYCCYQLGSGTTNNPYYADWKSQLSGAMVEPAVAGFALDAHKTVGSFTLSLDGNESGYTGGEDVNLYAISGTKATIAGSVLLVH